MAKKSRLRVLFIGNSHTYYHDLPAWFARFAMAEGYECDVTMLAHPMRAFAIFPYGYPAEERKQQNRFDESRIHYVE